MGSEMCIRDSILAEPDALTAFAGPRVIEQYHTDLMGHLYADE